MEKLLRENGLLHICDSSLRNHQAIHRQALTFCHPHLSEAEIQETYEAIWREATFNLRLIGRRLSMISSWADALDFLRNGVYVIHKVVQVLAAYAMSGDDRSGLFGYPAACSRELP